MCSKQSKTKNNGIFVEILVVAKNKVKKKSVSAGMDVWKQPTWSHY